MTRIAIFASGNGSNAQKIAEYFKDSSTVEIVLILSNKKDAYVLERADQLGIPSYVFTRSQFNNTHEVLDELKKNDVDFIVLAGFLLLIPEYLVDSYPEKIINIHPALLPSYGGKGMYGEKVHQAVCEAKEKETGITIHYVNNKYDDGEIIFQARVALNNNDTPEQVAQKVHRLEYEHYPKVIESVINN
ncbi:phosphoribosylglycinamide formyltransferase [Fulvivirga sediminis]|uniref:Phosphoribosylglycinamide formyltransferase n=1 Tax=Fulvivirga sediminis TaxID=2803949 RepID=A0A937K0Y1_9BACT|nr:phosphoribosylglycinamide formyltransferase [Fulvivirga sediminis]MBL3656861.1 phosphoribosylglycinamide formyltransferase [Fulvivirga sediminis]